jgi:hypothetical protein
MAPSLNREEMQMRLVVGVLMVVVATLANSVTALAQVPTNASPNYAGGWQCNFGYHRVGDRCEKTAVPQNASPNYAGGWQCNLGFKKVGEGCIRMSAEEFAEQQRMIALFRAQQRASEITYNGETFTLRDVARKCEAYVYDRENGDLECRSPLRFLGRRCSVSIDSWPDGSISCRGSELRPIERHCTVSMYSDNYGDVDC